MTKHTPFPASREPLLMAFLQMPAPLYEATLRAVAPVLAAIEAWETPPELDPEAVAQLQALFVCYPTETAAIRAAVRGLKRAAGGAA